MVLHAFDVLHVLVCLFASPTTLLSIHDVRWTFLLSKGWFAFSYSFCDRSEVELGIPKRCSGHLDRVTSWCPEVGLGIPKPTLVVFIELG